MTIKQSLPNPLPQPLAIYFLPLWIGLLWTFHVKEIIQYETCCVWLLSLIVFSPLSAFALSESVLFLQDFADSSEKQSTHYSNILNFKTISSRVIGSAHIVINSLIKSFITAEHELPAFQHVLMCPHRFLLGQNFSVVALLPFGARSFFF